MFAQLLPENAYVAYRARLEAFLNIPTGASDQDIHQLIESGFPATALKAMCEGGRVGPTECEQILPHSALAKRLALGQKLTLAESDHLFRLAHIIAMAEALFGSEEKATRWLDKAKVGLSGQSPFAMLSTLPGTRRVEEMLIQAAEGFVF